MNRLPIMYWLPKIHKTPVGARFIVASYYCSTNRLSDKMSKNFKMIFNTAEGFHKKKGFFIKAVRNYGLSKILLAKLVVILKLGLKSMSKRITSLMFLNIYIHRNVL